MPTRNVNLTAEQDAFVEAVVRAGRYQNASEASHRTRSRVKRTSRPDRTTISSLILSLAMLFERITFGVSESSLTRSGVEYILARHATAAAERQPSLARKRVTPHVLRHNCAMHSLQATGDIRKVALWLGHASIRSTEIYLRADPTEKLEALARLGAPVLKKGRFKAPDKVITMLKAAASPENYAE